MGPGLRDCGKKNLLGVLVDGVDYEGALEKVTSAAETHSPYAVTALAVHGLMEAVRDSRYRYRVNDLDLVTPDGQPVRWLMNLRYRLKLRERVYGPTLMGKLCAAASESAWPVYLYGSTQSTLDALARGLSERWPRLSIAGMEPSKFRAVSSKELGEIGARIDASGARMCFVGLGCPRQEVFVHELRSGVDLPLVAVGAAFDFYAGLLQEPPPWVQRAGLQWLHRLMQEPRRLWRRYLILNPWFMFLAGLQLARVYRPSPLDVEEPSEPSIPA